MKKVSKVKIWFASFLILMVGAFSVSASVAWFGKSDVINTNLLNGINGTVLTSYFHCGTGKADDPYIITRPKHFENLSLLHHNVEDFWRALGSGSIAESKGFYFEVGCSEDRLKDPSLSYASDEGKDKYVFDYDDYGFTSGNKSSTLNCISLKKDLLVPIGSTDKPFIGSLEGNNISIEDFTINGGGEADIGIFGYVGQYAEVRNTYFNNVTIDTTGNSIANSESINLDHVPHDLHAYKDTTFIGYIAGHALSSQSFDHVYVNNSVIKGSNGNQNNLDNYGYFGMIDHDDAGGGHGGKGNHYEFVLDAPSIYSYINSRYEDIGNAPMRLRNSGYNDENTINNETFDGHNDTIYPLSNGLARGGDLISGSGYDLVGKGPSNTTAARSYSLSTLGYFGSEYETTSYHELTYFKDGGEYKSMPYYASLIDYTSGASSSDASGARYGYNPDLQKWIYVSTPVFLKLTLPDQFQWNNGIISLQDYTDEEAYINLTLYLNNKTFTYNFPMHGVISGYNTMTLTYQKAADQVISLPLLPANDYKVGVAIEAVIHQRNTSLNRNYWGYGQSVSTGRVITLRTVSLTTSDVSLSLSSISSRNGGSAYRANASAAPTYATTSNGPFDIYTIRDSGDYEVLKMEQVSFDVNIDSYNPIRTDIDSSLFYDTLADYFGLYPEERTEDPTEQLAFLKEYFDEEKGPTGELDINTAVGCYSSEDVSVYWGFAETQELAIKYGVNVGDFYGYSEEMVPGDCTWYANYFQKTPVPGTEKDHWIAGTTDDETDPEVIAENEKNQIFASNYRYQNIDVVGGDINFGQTYITLRGATTRQSMSPTITSATIGQKFYAPEYAPNSIVLYLKNMGGSKPDDIMGKISFQYGWSVIGTYAKDPSFRGANGRTDVFNLETIADLYPDDYEYIVNGLNRTVNMNIRRQLIKNCAYCALDANGNILCGYNNQGREVGATGVLERDIDTYVIVFSVVNNVSSIVNTRIRRIEFSFDAISGSGGSFEHIDYRTSADTVVDSILNFFMFAPGDSNYSYYIKVEYADNVYDIEFKATTADIKMNVFLYPPTGETFTYKVNGTTYTRSEVNIPAQGGYSYS